jgi:hypothetical protein
MAHVLITGAKERPDGFELGDGKYYGAARLVRLNLTTGATETLLDIGEGNDHYPAEHPNLQFTSGCAEKKNLWLPTDTELRCYSYPEMTCQRVISHPFFQNVHSVAIIEDNLVCTSTGLDLVAVLDKSTGEPLRLVNVEGKDVWHRFRPDVDYRLVHSTRPHQGHPNYVFQWEGELWVTRCTQEDAVCLDDLNKRIDITGERALSVHDGHVVGDRIYFTSVDGCLRVADGRSRTIVEVIDLIGSDGERRAKGWCRGMLFDGDLVHVGFSRLRRTRDSGKLRWLVGFGRSEDEQAMVLTYDLRRRCKIREYPLSEGSLDAIYAILPAPA